MLSSPSPRAIGRPSAGLLLLLLLAVAVVLGLEPTAERGADPGVDAETFTCVEPSAAPYVTLKRDGDELVVTVDPLTRHPARLEWIEPEGATFRTGERRVEWTLDPNAGAREFRLVSGVAAESERWAVRLTLFPTNQTGSSANHGSELDRAIYSVDAVLDRATPAAPSGDRRVAVAIPQPDGRPVVQYLTRSDAEARGLTILEPRSADESEFAPRSERAKGGRR